MEPDEALRAKVDAFLKRCDMSPTAFGKAAANDPKFVFMLREGREPRKVLRKRILDWMAGYRNSAT